MNKLLLSVVLLGACGPKDEATAPPATPPATSPPQVEPPRVDAAAPPIDSSTDDGSGEIARLVVHDVGSKALGGQTIETSCVSVLMVPAGEWTVATAHLSNCGDKTARSIVWLYKRQGNGKWNEDYVGQPPKCWKSVPADLRDAVAAATKIPGC